MLLKFDTSQIEAKTDAVASLVELLRSQQTDMRERLKYLENLQNVADSKRNSELIRPRNVLMTTIHDNLGQLPSISAALCVSSSFSANIWVALFLLQDKSCYLDFTAGSVTNRRKQHFFV